MKKPYKLLSAFAGLPMMLGIVVITFGLLNLVVSNVASVFTGGDIQEYINSASYMVFPNYNSLISFISSGMMLIFIGLVMGVVIIGIIEPFIKYLKHG